jgi:DNA polymerase elongation subunit (family B)
MMQKGTGWILDVYIEDNEAILWVKTEQGQVLKLFDEYEPVFYIQPKNDKSGTEVLKILQDLELVKEVRWDYKLVDINSNTKTKLLYVRCYLIHHYNLLLKALQHETLQQRINQLFNTKLSHIQRYLFTQLRIPPTAKVQIEHEDGELVSITTVNDHEDLQVPFSTIQIEVVPFTEQEILDTIDPIKSIKIRHVSDDLVLEDEETKMLQEFSDYVISKDPDIVLFLNNDPAVLNYLLGRIKLLSLDLQLGRRKTDIYSNNENRVLEKWAQGRVYMNREHASNGLAGLIELSQFSYLPLRMILKYSIGRLISNRNIFELMTRGHAIPDNYDQRTHEHIRTLEEIVDRDKAGMIFSPQIGLHENVAVLDYNDEFANIIINENISYEHCDVESDKSSAGILPQIVKQIVDRRVCIKQFLKQLPNESIDANDYEHRANTLKKILVCLYGTTGSYWNRYGNVLAFEQINKRSREILLKTKDIVQELGYELIYADTDAAFVHKDKATKDEYEGLGEIISKQTGMALSVEYHYKYLVLLPLEADEKLEALKHYFGITYDDELITRGIETRRHDTPKFIKDFQRELLYTLFDANSTTEIVDRTLENALFCVTKTIDKIMTGEIDPADLIISKQLRMDLTKYRSLFPHVAAAIQLSKTNGKAPSRGDIIEYIYTDSRHQNPLNRVVTAEASDNYFGLEYDREKYKEMLLDASETALGIFGFDRTLYGKPKGKKWWLELRRNRLNDVQAEAGVR